MEAVESNQPRSGQHPAATCGSVASGFLFAALAVRHLAVTRCKLFPWRAELGRGMMLLCGAAHLLKGSDFEQVVDAPELVAEPDSDRLTSVHQLSLNLDQETGARSLPLQSLDVGWRASDPNSCGRIDLRMRARIALDPESTVSQDDGSDGERTASTVHRPFRPHGVEGIARTAGGAGILAHGRIGRGELGTISRAGKNYQRWQHKPTMKGDPRIWFYVDQQTVYLEQVHTHDPNATK
ncbi:hypothetical protein KNO15_14470 [Leifsonia shinshuensis]|uniref:hypothetical protein n=1 Tax=Leifsonia shinshuensis TaxID=150026 RepID=UPI001F5140E6|nr:hypothetical protein [Leifsonia shinshuensis]MCI0157901.1 hypothetical protein [Leifsonia shinshuensis]